MQSREQRLTTCQPRAVSRRSRRMVRPSGVARLLAKWCRPSTCRHGCYNQTQSDATHLKTAWVATGTSANYRFRRVSVLWKHIPARQPHTLLTTTASLLWRCCTHSPCHWSDIRSRKSPSHADSMARAEGCCSGSCIDMPRWRSAAGAAASSSASRCAPGSPRDAGGQHARQRHQLLRERSGLHIRA